MTTSDALSILYIGTLPPYPGGSALSSAQLLARFAERGHRVRAVAPSTAATEAQERAFAAAHPRLQVVRFAVPHFDFDHTNPAGDSYRKNERAAVRARVRELIEADRADVVMIGRESFASHVVDLAIDNRIPLLLRVAGGFTTELLNGTLPAALADVLREALGRADLVVSPAEHLAVRLRADLGLASVITIPNAVDLQMFAPRPRSATLLSELSIPEDAGIVLHASNLVSSKRPLDVVASASAVLAVEPNLVYVITGDGPMRDRMEVECRKRGLWKRFRFAGWVEYQHMPLYLNLADVVVMPAETETLARVYLETLACGRVLVASDIAAVREVVDDGRSGLLHRCGDPDDLARKTLIAVQNPDLRAVIRSHARERARAHDLNEAVDAYLERFAQLQR